MRGRETAPREWICRPLIMGGDYTGEIGEGKGVCWARGPPRDSGGVSTVDR